MGDAREVAIKPSSPSPQPSPIKGEGVLQGSPSRVRGVSKGLRQGRGSFAKVSGGSADCRDNFTAAGAKAGGPGLRLSTVGVGDV